MVTCQNGGVAAECPRIPHAIGVGRRITRPLVTLPDLIRTLPHVAGAAVIYFYFGLIGPIGLRRPPAVALAVFLAVTATLVVSTFLYGARLFRPLQVWRA